MGNEDKILQIIPAEGWFALYRNEGQPDEREAVVCFALVETKEERGQIRWDVRPMSWCDGYVDFCDTISNFSGIVRADEVTSTNAK